MMYETLGYEDGQPTEPIVGSTFTPQFQQEIVVLYSGLDAAKIVELRDRAINSGEMEIVCPEVADFLYGSMIAVNDDKWNLRITGMYQPPTLITYRTGVPVHGNGWHTDYAQDDRSKIGISVLLQNARKGGAFQHRYDWPPGTTHLEVGQALVIPGYVPHRIAPITRGVRVALVAWLGGPEWK